MHPNSRIERLSNTGKMVYPRDKNKKLRKTIPKLTNMLQSDSQRGVQTIRQRANLSSFNSPRQPSRNDRRTSYLQVA
jgi:hypothetical protein